MNSIGMKKESIKALLYSSIYVGLGTIPVLCGYGGDWCYTEWMIDLSLLTFPVSIFAIAVRFQMSNGFLIPTIVVQLITLIITWRIVLQIMRKFSR